MAPSVFYADTNSIPKPMPVVAIGRACRGSVATGHDPSMVFARVRIIPKRRRLTLFLFCSILV